MRITVILFVVLLATTLTQANTMIVHQADGTALEIRLSEIQRVTFTVGETIAQKKIGIGKVQALSRHFAVTKQGASLTFELTNSEAVSLEVFDTKGRLVRTLENRVFTPGSHKVNWDTHDNDGHTSSGNFLIRARIGNDVIAKRLVILQ